MQTTLYLARYHDCHDLAPCTSDGFLTTHHEDHMDSNPFRFEGQNPGGVEISRRILDDLLQNMATIQAKHGKDAMHYMTGLVGHTAQMMLTSPQPEIALLMFIEALSSYVMDPELKLKFQKKAVEFKTQEAIAKLFKPKDTPA